MNYGKKQKITIKKKVISVTLIAVVGVQMFPPSVIAQNLPLIEGLEMVVPAKDPQMPSSASAVLGATTDPGFSVQQALDALSGEDAIQSAKFQASTRIHRLYKKHFGMREKVTFVVDNPRNDDKILTKIIDTTGKQVAAKVEKFKKNESLVISILPPVSFAPGKYNLIVEDLSDGQRIEQDFTWGVLAINTNKSVYLPQETAKIALAVLDEEGEMVCDASLELRITKLDIASNGQELSIDDVLSTGNGQIKVNSECFVKDFTQNPDYETSYIVDGPGIYQMDLTATTKNGVYSIEDSFEVHEAVPFDIERTTATRIYPPKNYPVEIKLTANEDFEGTIVETVPESFDVFQSSGSGILAFDRLTVGTASVTPTSDVLGTSTSLLLPFIGNHTVTQLFGEAALDEKMNSKYEKYGVIGHDGVDFDVPIGTTVVTVDDGEVVYARVNGDYGTTVAVRHSWGQSYYGHLSEMLVDVGDKIKKGEKIAESGDTGLSSDPHLHFGIKLADNNPKNGYFGKIDPAPLLGITKVTDILGVSSRSEESVKMLTWDISLQKGETVTLGYSYKASLSSPQFYTLGPLRLYNNNAFVFGEKRVWQIAVDATTTVRPNGNGTVTSWTSTNSNAIFSEIDDDPDSPTDADFVTGPLNSDSSMFVTLGDMPADFLSASSIEVKARHGELGAGNDRVALEYQIYQSNETTAVTAETTFGQVTDDANSSVTYEDDTANVSITGTNDKTTWDGARLRIRQDTTQVQGGDNDQGRIAAVEINMVYTALAPDLQQIHYRWRNDDGDEANATFRRAEDTSLARAKSITMRLRVEVSNEGLASATSTTYRLEYGTLATSCSAIGAWTAVPVTPTTEHFDIEADASGITDGSATTDVSTGGGLTNENTTFVAGEFKDTGNTTSGISLSTTQFTELEYAIQANTNAVNGTTYCFRVTNSGSTTNMTYPVYPEWTIGEPSMDQNHYRWRNDDGGETILTDATITLHPTGQGNYTAWAATGCTNDTAEWDCVNDNNNGSGTPGANDGATTHLTGTTGRSSFTLDDLLPGGASVTQLEVFVIAAEENGSGGNATLTAFYRLGSSDTDCGTTDSYGGTTYTTQSCTFSGLSLTGTDVNNMEIGILYGSNDPDVSKVYVTVTYSTTAATWKQAEDTAHSGQDAEENIRLRVEVANTGGIAATRRLQIAYAEQTDVSCGDETFTAIPTSAGSEFQMTDSVNFGNEDATTTQLTATGTFVSGDMLDTANQPASGFSIDTSFYTEMEYNFLVNTSAGGKTWCFKLTDNGTDLDTYTVYPVLVVVADTGPTLNQLLRHGAWFDGTEQPFTF